VSPGDAGWRCWHFSVFRGAGDLLFLPAIGAVGLMNDRGLSSCGALCPELWWLAGFAYSRAGGSSKPRCCFPALLRIGSIDSLPADVILRNPPRGVVVIWCCVLLGQICFETPAPPRTDSEAIRKLIACHSSPHAPGLLPQTAQPWSLPAYSCQVVVVRSCLSGGLIQGCARDWSWAIRSSIRRLSSGSDRVSLWACLREDRCS